MPGFYKFKGNEDDEEIIIRTDSTDYRSRCGRNPPCCVVTVILLSVAVLILSIALALTKAHIEKHVVEYHSLDGTICGTPECLSAAGQTIAMMNLSVDPCDNFYQYACGNFIVNQFLEPSERKVGQFGLISKGNDKILYKALVDDKKSLFGRESTALSKARQIYSQCMNVIELEKKGPEPLTNHLKSLGISFLSNSDGVSSGWNLKEKLLELNKQNFFPLMSVSVEADDKNSKVNIITFNQHGITLDSEKDYNASYDKNETRLKHDAFVDYGVEMLRLLNYSKSESKVMMEEIYELERRLAEVYVPKEIIRDSSKSYHRVKLMELQSIFGSHLDLSSHLSEVLQHTITDNTDIVTFTYSYLENVSAIISEYTKEPNNTRILNNYLAWYVMHRTGDYLSVQFQLALLVLSKATNGITSLEARWKTCTQLVDSLMGRVSGSLFIEGRFGPDDRQDVVDIIGSIRTVLLDRFDSYSWMDALTRNAATAKAKAMKTMVGYPDYITNATDIDEHYGKLSYADSYFKSQLNYRRWTILKMSEKLDKPVDEKKWDMSASTVNAYYDPVKNLVVLPAGILRKPFYDYRLPLAWKYGSMGSVVGHEMSHGFDDQGSKYDEIGNLNDWWTKSSRDNFNAASQCLVDQYSEYSVQGVHLNAALNLGENIADNGGLSLSYESYIKKATDGDATTLPGLNLTHKQLFFLSFAQIWCEHATPQYALSNLNYNSHSPAQFRVQGALSNTAEFSQAYNCNKDDKYNPTKKCKVW